MDGETEGRGESEREGRERREGGEEKREGGEEGEERKELGQRGCDISVKPPQGTCAWNSSLVQELTVS